MPRNMSFSMTTQQMREQTKTVTRRFGWNFLKAGEVVNAVEKTMGLRKGEKIKLLCQIKILSVRGEPLNAITQEDCAREGFPDMSPDNFVHMLMQHYRVDPTQSVNRIEFEFLP
ncbi:hypothetical protein [Pseudovibrio sp. Tun.PSC04-5.I4]|uniref:hypothetical protein n=1 Tax=Pseudovibrio sp. Tun.PSC04-5.I4 TaxID=1798213 RepID=UPI000885B367|nr:hypothetical protein [Pseudovibrio sp. Tun.PSC04-5.I4]SDR34927.1 hypothetical protein SAMN04515695_4795 [Pseudovibrio sp. Tun.PSC04-5.I4]